MAERRASGWAVSAVEQWAEHLLPKQNFTLIAKADLIETKSQSYAATDYKTGSLSSVAVVKAGFDPQLPLTAFLLEQGAFEKLLAHPTQELNYVRVKGAGTNKLFNPVAAPLAKKGYDVETYIDEALETLEKLIAEYEKPETAYYCQPRAQYVHEYSDYNHLARKDEWARLGESADG